MDEKKKKQYIIIGVITAIAFIAVVAVPSPNQIKKGIDIPQVVSPNAAELVIPIATQKSQNEKKEVVEEEHFNRSVKRDIFINPILNSGKEAEQQTTAIISPEKPAEKKIKITGVMITDKKKSISLDDGRILYEKDIVDGYIISKIGREEVLLISRDGSNSKRVNVWGDEE